jgi:LysR family nitrogen assimilation transcriptional regulator
MGSAIIPKGDLSDASGSDLAKPLLIEPPLFLTASIIASGDFPLTFAAEAVRNVVIKFVEGHFHSRLTPGAEWIESNQS